MEFKLLALFGSLIVLAAELFQSLGQTVNVILNVAALAVLAAGFLVFGKLRAQATAAAGASEAWREERDAAVVRADRLAAELAESDARLHAALVQIATLEARPTLESLEEEIRKLAKLVLAANEAAAPSPATDTVTP